VKREDVVKRVEGAEGAEHMALDAIREAVHKIPLRMLAGALAKSITEVTTAAYVAGVARGAVAATAPGRSKADINSWAVSKASLSLDESERALHSVERFVEEL